MCEVFVQLVFVRMEMNKKFFEMINMTYLTAMKIIFVLG